MMLKEWVAKIWANNVAKILESKSKIPGEVQKREFEKILSKARSTVFGRDHHLDEVSNVKEFQQAVPIRDYEQFLPYIDRVKAGEKDVLWPGMPLYLTKTSGTTSGTKYIPISSDSISNHIDSARNALLSYIADTGNTSFINGKMIFFARKSETGKNQRDSNRPVVGHCGASCAGLPSKKQIAFF